MAQVDYRVSSAALDFEHTRAELFLVAEERHYCLLQEQEQIILAPGALVGIPLRLPVLHLGQKVANSYNEAAYFCNSFFSG